MLTRFELVGAFWVPIIRDTQREPNFGLVVGGGFNNLERLFGGDDRLGQGPQGIVNVAEAIENGDDLAGALQLNLNFEGVF